MFANDFPGGSGDSTTMSHNSSIMFASRNESRAGSHIAEFSMTLIIEVRVWIEDWLARPVSILGGRA